MRRSTDLGAGSHFSLTCDHCWTALNSFGPTWGDVDREAMAEGWGFTGYGMSAREYCGRCL